MAGDELTSLNNFEIQKIELELAKANSVLARMVDFHTRDRNTLIQLQEIVENLRKNVRIVSLNEFKKVKKELMAISNMVTVTSKDIDLLKTSICEFEAKLLKLKGKPQEDFGKVLPFRRKDGFKTSE